MTTSIVRHESRTASRAGLGLLVLAGTLWGAGGLTGTLLGRHTGLGSAAIAAYRLGVGGLLLLVFLLTLRRPLPRGRSRAEG